MTIHCSVANCHYWKNGNICDANEIMVTSDSIGAQYPDDIDAPVASQVAASPVSTCMETCCKTFVPSGSKHEKVDGVYRK